MDIYILICFCVTLTITRSAPAGTGCADGFVQCTDGSCEAFEALCGDQGIVTVVTVAPISTISTTETERHTSTTPGISVSTVSQTTLTTTSAAAPTVHHTTAAPVTDSSGNEVCIVGWETCADGTCEPFHWMCTEHDGSYNFTTHSTRMTSSTERTTTATMMSGASVSISSAAPVMTSILSIVTTTQPAATTDDSGQCANGWELCKDGICEPFHLLCNEHDGSSGLIG